MKQKFICSFIFLILSFIGFSQDVIAKKDSTNIVAKVLEVSQDEIKYRRFNYLDGPLYVVQKNEIAYIVYSNGVKEIFKTSENGTISNDHAFINSTSPKGSVKRPDSIGNYIKFNIQVAIVVYNSFSNAPKKDYLAMTSSDEYKNVSTKQNVAFNIGCNFVFGKSGHVKHIIGVNYLQTKSEFYYKHGSIGYSSYAKYRSNVAFVNIVTGLRFSLFKKLHLEPLIALNIVANSRTTRNGTETSFDWQTSPYTRYTTSFENEPTYTLVKTTVSFAPKISYNIPIKKIKMEAYLAYNFPLRYRLPWYQFGVHIFPFKKLR